MPTITAAKKRRITSNIESVSVASKKVLPITGGLNFAESREKT